MSRYNRRTYVHIDPDHPLPVGTCDYSGMRFLHKDLVKQYEYNSDGLYYTGQLVYKGFADKPNPQRLTPYVAGDMRPVMDARANLWPSVWSYLELDVTELENEYEQSLTQAGYMTQTYTGSRTSDLTFIMPPTLAEWTLTNATGGGFTIHIQQKGEYISFPILPFKSIILYSTFSSLSLTPPYGGEPANPA